MRGTAQPDRAVQRTGNRFVPLVHRLEQVDADPVGEAGNGHLRQFLRGAGHVQRAADTGTRLVQQGQPLLGHMLLADIECRAVHASDPPAPILDRRHTDGQRPAVGVDENGTDNRDVHRLTRLYHLAKLLDHLAKLLGSHVQTGHGRQQLVQVSPALVRLVQAELSARCGVHPADPQVGVVERQIERGLLERPVQQRPVIVPAPPSWIGEITDPVARGDGMHIIGLAHIPVLPNEFPHEPASQALPARP